MAKLAVYEGSGCPACRRHSYGQIAGLDTRVIMNVVQGGAVGAAAGIAADFVSQRLLKITNPMIRGVLSILVPIGIATAVRRQNPQMAENIAIGGAAVGLYSLLKGMIAPRLGLSGYGEELLEEPEIEITEGYDALVPELEEVEGYGALVPELEEVEGFGQDIEVIEE